MSTPTRAALYARYSSDRQRETSIADQLRGCRELAVREAWPVVAEHKDEAVSASTPVALRQGGKALLADALAGRWEVLIIEGLDRLSREVGEQESIVKRLEHRGIRIIGTSDGYDSGASGRKVMRIARGLVNELYLDDLRAKTHRGLAGQFERGLHVGGVSYGYTSEDAAGGRRLAVDEPAAAIVREIFQRFAAGETTRAIVHDLNARAVPGPRGGPWAISALSVSAQRQLGLLHNTLYIGREVWNRRQWIKDPDTGKRRYVERPAAEWRTRETPALRIVDQAVWDAAQRRIAAGQGLRARRGKGASPRTLLAGLLRCAACTGPMMAIDARRYGCAAHKDRGPSVCASSVAVSRKALELRLLADLRAEMLAPDAMAEAHRAVREAVAARTRASRAGTGAAVARLQALEGEISRLADAVAQLGLSGALRERLMAAEAEHAQLLEQQRAAEEKTPRVDVDGLAARWRGMVMDLGGVLAGEDRDRARGLLADLLGPVMIGRDAATGDVYADLEEPAERLLVQAVGAPLGMVAGARFSPGSNLRGHRRRLILRRRSPP